MTLDGFFRENRKLALAFSGGTDSAYLLYAAINAGADVAAYYVKSAFQPQWELRDAERLARQLGARMRVLTIDVLSSDDIASNPPARCYHCKRMIKDAIRRAAEDDGYTLMIDGTNASDDAGDRPGMRAVAEYGVRSPLRECAIAKSDVRRLSKEAGLFTWDKPAYACLATRIPSGEAIDMDKLEKTEKAEDFLSSIGFSDFRVRLLSGCARIQVRAGEIPLLMEKRKEIAKELGAMYKAVLFDMEARDE